jgi:signal peptidase
MRILAGATTALRRIVDLALVALILVVLFGVALCKGTPLLGRQAIIVGGGSMEPTIGLGSAIVIGPVDPATLAAGDVVSMQVGPERTTYTHRIVAVVDHADGRWIRTQGDANPAPDPTLVPARAVIGRVELVVPLAGYLIAVLSLPMGVMFVLGLAATLLAIAWLLESLELERPPRRSPAATRPESGPPDPAVGPVTGGEPVAAAEAMAPPIAALLQGEPIAARPTDGRGGPGSGRKARVPRGSSRANRASGGGAAPGHARPTVREQLARSRELRDRRVRWLLGRERNPLTD